MKNLIIAAITVASFLAVAQTSTIAPKAPTAKKAKAATAKKAVKPAQATTLPETTAQPQPGTEGNTTTLSPAGETNAAKAAAVNTTDSSAAGTSTITAADAAATKKWKGSVSVVGGNSQDDAQWIQVLTKAGLSYKLSDKYSVKISQTFETMNIGNSTPADQREVLERSNFRSAFTDLGISTTLKGILGSKDLPISLNYKKMTGDALYVQKTFFPTIDAIVDFNLSVPYALNPKFDLSIDTQTRYFQNDVAAKSSMRLLVAPTLTYNMNDIISIYQVGGGAISTKDNMDIRKSFEIMYISTGVGIAATKNLSIDMNIWQYKALYASTSTNRDVTGFALYKTTAAANDDRTYDLAGYEASLAYSF